MPPSRIVDDPTNASFIMWAEDENGFKITNTAEFRRHISDTQTFKQNNVGRLERDVV